MNCSRRSLLRRRKRGKPVQDPQWVDPAKRFEELTPQQAAAFYKHRPLDKLPGDLLEQEADRVAKWFPGLEFRLVTLRDGNFNFVEIEPAVIQPEMAVVSEDAGQTA